MPIPDWPVAAIEKYIELFRIVAVHDMLSRAILVDGKAANRKSYEEQPMTVPCTQ
jgi:hypothetical protein